MEINIYTDGSHIKGTQTVSYGAWAQIDNREYRLAGCCDEEKMASYQIAEEISNPTAEFVAFASVLEILARYPKEQLADYSFVFHIDYIGINHWMLGTWKARKSHVQKLKKYCQDLIKEKQLKIYIRHVKAHSGVRGNEEADSLAKSNSIINDFDLLG